MMQVAARCPLLRIAARQHRRFRAGQHRKLTTPHKEMGSTAVKYHGALREVKQETDILEEYGYDEVTQLKYGFCVLCVLMSVYRLRCLRNLNPTRAIACALKTYLTTGIRPASRKTPFIS